MIAALYVAENGCYFGLPNVEPWDEPRDARLYDGPWPVVAHPPCQRWGRYWSGGPSAKVRRIKGDDGGCFAAAIAAVRKYGGLLEHPEATHAWRAFGLLAPPKSGGWVPAGDFLGWTCCVEQGHYGHAARKATWLYAVGCELPTLKWGPAPKRQRLEPGFHSREERKSADAARRLCKRLSEDERVGTPIPFRDLLISMAESATRQRAHRNIARLVEERDRLTQLIAMWTRQLDGRNFIGIEKDANYCQIARDRLQAEQEGSLVALGRVERTDQHGEPIARWASGGGWSGCERREHGPAEEVVLRHAPVDAHRPEMLVAGVELARIETTHRRLRNARRT